MPTYLTPRLLLLTLALTLLAHAQAPFLTNPQWVAMREESTGSAPFENLRILTRLHRVPATPEFDQAAAFILSRAQEYGLDNAHEEHFPIDGKLHYGLMRSHLGWKVEQGSLWQVTPTHTLIGDWATDPIRLADYSHTANVTAQLVDVGPGTSPANYTGKDIRGKIVLADGVLSTVQALAVLRFGAAGIVSDMPNQTTAWSGQDPTLIRWGHLDATAPTGFAFMVSPSGAADLRTQLAHGPVSLHAHVQAEVGPGAWTVVTATIPGTDPSAGEVVFSCHLDHQRPGANDNASGCVTILESARVLHRLIAQGKLPPPLRTIRFLWGPEVEGTMAFLSTHPDLRRQMRANIHMDMVGGDPFRNKSILHVTETPWSLPTFVTDIGETFSDAIRTATITYAEDGTDPAAAVLEQRDGALGTRNQLFVDRTPYAEGSDHDDFDSSTIAIPSLYLRDWPDVYIHTDHDSLDKIDPTKLRRVALLGVASGYTYATLSAASAPALYPVFVAHSSRRLAATALQALTLVEDPATPPAEAWFEAHNLLAQSLTRELAELSSFAAYTSSPQPPAASATLTTQTSAFNQSLAAAAHTRGLANLPSTPPWASDPAARRIPQRIGDFGPLTYQNDNVLLDRLGPDRLSAIQIFHGAPSRFVSVQDKSQLYAYEILNFVDGKRSVGDIRDAVAAELGPLPLALVANFLDACRDANIITYR